MKQRERGARVPGDSMAMNLVKRDRMRAESTWGGTQKQTTMECVFCWFLILQGMETIATTPQVLERMFDALMLEYAMELSPES